MATNNAGNLLDSSGNVFVDFVHGSFPMQPNDDRADGTPSATITVGGDQNVSWTRKGKIDSARLDPSLSNHANAEARWAGFPAFTANSVGKKSGGVWYIKVPAILGFTLASALDALKDAGYEAANITTASAAANAVSVITDVARTLTVATITSSGAGAKYPVGTKITVASLASPDTALNGTFTVTAVATNTVSYVTSTSGSLSTGSLSVNGLSGVAGTVKSQSTAADANTISTNASITVTPHAVVS